MHKKILILCSFPFDRKIKGGVQSATNSLIEGLEYYSKEYDINICSFDDTISDNCFITVKGINYFFLLPVKNPILRPRFLWNIPKIRKVIKKINPDIIDVIDNLAMLLAALAFKKSKFYSIHGIKSVEAKVRKGEGYLSYQAEKYVQNYCLRKYDNFIIISDYTKEIFRNKLSKNKNVCLIPNAVSENFIKGEEAKENDSEKIKILNVGSFSWLKSQHILLETVKTLSKFKKLNIEVNFCGEICDSKYYKYLKSFGLNNVTFLNTLDYTDVKKIMLDNNLLIHTSKQENTPMVFLEAMACKLPIISSRIGGVNYLLENDKYGTTYDYGNSNQLMELILKYSEDKTVFLKKSHLAYLHCKDNYNPKKIASKTLKCFESIK